MISRKITFLLLVRFSIRYFLLQKSTKNNKTDLVTIFNYARSRMQEVIYGKSTEQYESYIRSNKESCVLTSKCQDITYRMQIHCHVLTGCIFELLTFMTSKMRHYTVLPCDHSSPWSLSGIPVKLCRTIASLRV